MASNKDCYTCLIENMKSDSPIEMLKKIVETAAKQYGDVISVDIKRNTDSSLNTCSILFSERENALKAVEYFDGRDWNEEAMKAKLIEPNLYTLRIVNITTKYSIDELKERFKEILSQFGELFEDRVNIAYNETCKKNFCTVNYLSEKDAKMAESRLNGLSYDGLKLKCHYKNFSSENNSNVSPKIMTEEHATSSMFKKAAPPLQLDIQHAPVVKSSSRRNDVRLPESSIKKLPETIENRKNFTCNRQTTNHQPIEQKKLRKPFSVDNLNRLNLDSGHDDASDDDSYDSDESVSNLSVASMKSIKNDNNNKSRIIFNGKFLKKSFDIRLSKLSKKFDLKYSLETTLKSLNLNVILTSKQSNELDLAFKEISSWKVSKRFVLFDNNQTDQLNNLLKIVNLKKGSETYLKINWKKRKIEIYGLTKNIVDEVYDKVRDYFENNLVTKKTFVFFDREKYEFAKYYLNKMKNDQIKCEFSDSNGPNKAKIQIEGSKKNLDKLVDLKNVNCKEHKFDSKLTLFQKSKMSSFKNSFEKKNCQLKFYDSGFKIFGFNDDDELDALKTQVNYFLASCKSDKIDLNENQIEKAAKIIDEYKKANKENDNDDDEGIDHNLDINLNRNLKKIFINGVDHEEIQQAKEFILDRLKDSQIVSETVKFKEICGSKITEDFIKSLKAQSEKNFRIFLNKYMIKISGTKKDVNEAFERINVEIKTINARIDTKSLEIEAEELDFLSKENLEIEKIQKKTKSLVTLENFTQFANFSYKQVAEFYLILGDLTEIPVDAYVNPANAQLNHGGGLAKEICQKAGKEIVFICNEYLKNNSLNEGDVMITKSAKMGLKDTCKIIHAVGPMWKNGVNNEESKLEKAIISSLQIAAANNCSSIAIPPISTGIFGYPLREALDVITKAAFKYFDSNKKSVVKRVFFMSNEEKIVNEWQSAIEYINNLNGISVSSTHLGQANNKKWYWMDDQGLWKAYKNEYATIIESHFNRNELNFQMKIEGKDYSIDLSNPQKFTQTNVFTGYVHSVINNPPTTKKWSWYWFDDSKCKSPYASLHSDQIEKAFSSGKSHIDLNIKRHDDDQEHLYQIQFVKDQTYQGIQCNLTTKSNIRRQVFREENTILAQVSDSNNYTYISSKRKLIFITGFGDDAQNSLRNIELFIKNSYVTDIVPFTDISLTKLRQLESMYNAKIEQKDKIYEITAIKSMIDKIKSEILIMSVQDSVKHSYPDYWTQMNHTDDLLVSPVPDSSSEYREIYNQIAQTVPAPKIIKIERIQNKWLWKMYKMQSKVLEEKGSQLNECFLFHGTRNNQPINIYRDQVGFDMRFSNQGMWGQGIYFAQNASYSYNYSSINDDQTYCMFRVRVALGDYIQLPSDKSLRIPPIKPQQSNNKFNNLRYDSIKGNTGGSDVFIIYENSRAYPEYLITFNK